MNRLGPVRSDAAWRETIPGPLGVFGAAAIAIGLGLFVGTSVWPQHDRALEVSILMLTAVLTAVLERLRPAAKDRATMPLSFVINLAALLLAGPKLMMLVAATGIVAEGFFEKTGFRPYLSNAATVGVASVFAGLACWGLGGTTGSFVWPWQAVPIAAAVLTYCIVSNGSVQIQQVLTKTRAVNRTWLQSSLQQCSHYVLGAGVAVAFAEVVNHRAWEIVLVGTIPLFLAYLGYCGHPARHEGECPRGVIDSLDHGVAVVDGNGKVTLWNEALARITGCPRERALGRALTVAAPILRQAELAKSISEVLVTRSPRTLTPLRLPATSGGVVLQARLLPDADGVTVHWQDVTERFRAEHALRRSQARLALVAAGANDGLWEWDLRSQEVYFSDRWRSMLGLPVLEGSGRSDEWFHRIHPDDMVSLKDALELCLSGKADHFQHEHRIRHEDGTYRKFLCRGRVMRGAGQQVTHMGGSLTEAAERGNTDEGLRMANFRDPLTGLCNRTVFVNGLGRRLDDFKHHRGGRFATLYLDLDRFKVVNDSLGHLVGDELLIAVSRRLESCLRKGDAIARLGGDEFALLLNGLVDEGQANAIAFRMQDALRAPFSIGGREVYTSASIGIAFSTKEYNNPEEMMRDADTAMYHAKARGKARHELFDADMHARALDRLSLESDLRHAVKNNDFEVHYQPIVSLATGMCAGFEALVRWTRKGQPVSPATFVPVAEELGLIESLGTWVLQKACSTFADWQQRFPGNRPEYITVNVSTRQLMQQSFMHVVEQAVNQSGIEPSALRLEITETTLMDSPHVAAETLRELRDFGVKIYLDDFGTGFSSLSHLHKLPVDALKIDRLFVKSLLVPDRPAIVESILALARTLKTGVVAEGIESDEQARELERLGCLHAQGYFFSPPLADSSVEELLATAAPLGRMAHSVAREQGIAPDEFRPRRRSSGGDDVPAKNRRVPLSFPRPAGELSGTGASPLPLVSPAICVAQ